MKRSYGTSIKQMSGDGDGKFGKRLANKATRRIVKSDIEEGVVGKPSVKQKKLFIIEERRYVYPRTFGWDLYADKEKKFPHWSEWTKHKAYNKRNTRDNALDRIIRDNKKDDIVRSDFGEKEFRAVDLKKIKTMAKLKALKYMKGIDKVKHTLNIARVRLALQEKRMDVYKALNTPKAITKCQIEMNESKIEILKLENKLIKHKKS